MIRFAILLISLILTAMQPGAATAQSSSTPAAPVRNAFTPAAMVNDDVVTVYDVEQRARLIILSSGGKAPANIGKLALNTLIEDHLKLQAAARAGITAPPSEINAAISQAANRIKLTPEQFIASLAEQNVTRESLAFQFKAEIAWKDLIRTRFGHRAQPSDADINAEMNLVGDTQGKMLSYRLSEIAIPARRSDGAKLATIARQIQNKLAAGADFAQLAREISAAPTAKNGGAIGWVHADQLPPEVRDVIEKMHIGDTSQPIRTSVGFVVLKLDDRRVETVSGIAPVRYTLKQIVVRAAPDASDDAVEAAMKEARKVRSQLSICANVDDMKDGYADISGDLGALQLDQIPVALRDAVVGLKVGETTPPIRSNDGIHVVMLCGKTGGIGKAAHDQMRARLIENRFARFSEGYLQELRRDAIIETR